MYNKYKNKKVKANGVKYDSKKEAKRGLELKLMEKAKLISNLELQKRYELQPSYTNNNGKHIRAIYYIADFVYYDNKQKKYIIEDVKGYRNEVYKLKKKLFEYKYNLVIKEI